MSTALLVVLIGFFLIAIAVVCFAYFVLLALIEASVPPPYPSKDDLIFLRKQAD